MGGAGPRAPGGAWEEKAGVVAPRKGGGARAEAQITDWVSKHILHDCTLSGFGSLSGSVENGKTNMFIRLVWSLFNSI